MLELSIITDDGLAVLEFEHSLVSVSKWEAKHKIPFLTTREKKSSEMLSYFQDMIVTPGVDKNLVYVLSPDQMDELTEYINAVQTASSVPQGPTKKFNNETLTSELIYYWMVTMKIPFHPAETWHLSRLLMLIQIYGFKNQPAKKRNAREVWADWSQQNAERKKKFGISG